MTTYSGSFAAAVGSYLAQLTGIPASVGTTWALAESGVGNNPYGVTDGNGTLYHYGTWQQGVQAAADLITSSSAYAGIRAAIKSGNPQTIGQAIIASPWNGANHYAGSTAWMGAGYTVGGMARAGGPPPVAGATGPSPVSGAANAPAPNSTQAQGPGLSLFSGLFAWVPTALGDLVVLGLVLILVLAGLHLLLPPEATEAFAP